MICDVVWYIFVNEHVQHCTALYIWWYRSFMCAVLLLWMPTSSANGFVFLLSIFETKCFVYICLTKHYSWTLFSKDKLHDVSNFPLEMFCTARSVDDKKIWSKARLILGILSECVPPAGFSVNFSASVPVLSLKLNLIWLCCKFFAKFQCLLVDCFCFCFCWFALIPAIVWILCASWHWIWTELLMIIISVCFLFHWNIDFHVLQQLQSIISRNIACIYRLNGYSVHISMAFSINLP